MRACIHGGAVAVGGSCVELEHDGRRLLLDLGLPLDMEQGEPATLPAVPGLRADSDGLVGIVISHAHPDHFGLLPQVRSAVPVYGPAHAQRMLRAASIFVGAEPTSNWLPLEDRQTEQLGPFELTPLLVDHSAYESYALLVEAGGRRLLYSGDLRAHGRKPGLWQRLLREPPKSVHALLLEGTRLSRAEQHNTTEQEVEEQLANLCRHTAGMVLAFSSGQNIDRLERVGVPARLDLASKLLCRMTADELLVGLPLRFVPGARRPGKPAEPRKAWAITQRAIAVYASARDGEPHDYKVRPLSDPRAGVGARKLRHDLGVVDLLVSLLAHTLSEPMLTLRAGDRDRELRVNVSPENWWGAQHLLMTYTPPTRIEGQRGEVSAARFIAPDGFCVIGVRGPVEDVALPLLVEHDSGIRSLHEVTDQLQAHAESARSGALLSRFPELAGIPAHTSPDGQRPAWVPVLFATRGMVRAGNIARAAAERDKAVRYWQPGMTTGRPPQYATASHRVHELGLLAPVLSLHAPERGEQPLLRVLLTDYRHWLAGQLPAHDAILTLDRKGALGDKGAISRTTAPRRRADAQRDRELAAVKHRELDNIRARQREREAEREGLANAPAQWSVSGDV